MALTLLTPDALRLQTWRALGLPPEAGDADAVAAALRRAAGTLCPCPPRTLIDAVASSLDGLANTEAPAAQPKRVLGRLLAIGDLFELAVQEEPGGPRRRTIYAAPPAFCRVRPGHLVVVGLVPEQPTPLPESVERAASTVDLVRHVEDPSGEHASALRAAGFAELPERVWLWSPEAESAEEHRARYDRALDREGVVTSEPDVEVLDPDRPLRFYKGRWTPLAASHSGRFVARRPRRYGADAWSYVEVERGEVVRLLDLPLLGSATPADVRPYCRACDQAWHLQAALDALRGSPQPIRVHPPRGETVVVDLFAPPPAWLDRRWAVLGRSHPPSRGALVSWAFPTVAAQTEVNTATRLLWLDLTPDA